MEVIEIADETETPAASRQKRSRAGCLTCRRRRRKCDEKKPTCQNCIAKGFDCRYAEAFQILGKHNYTPEVPSEVKYTNLRFVTDKNEKTEEKDDVEAAAQDNRPGTSSSDQRRPATQGNASPDASHHFLAAYEASSPSIERYEYALHGLIALGNAGVVGEETQLNGVSEILSKDAQPAPFKPDDTAQGQARETAEEFSVHEFVQSQRIQSWPSVGTMIVSEVPELRDERVLDLLKHYRYTIAPWLDICDVNQCFGCDVLHLSNLSTSLRYGLLALADTSLFVRKLSPESNVAVLAPQCRRESNQDRTQLALLDTLEAVRAVVEDLSSFWLQGISTGVDQGVLENLLPMVNSGSLAASVFWLMARLQLSVALVNTASFRIPLPASITDRGNLAAGHTDDVFRCAQEAVALCIDATIFSRGDDDRWLQRRYGLNRVDLWTTLVTGFERWYRYRPQEFQPVIELYPKDGIQSEDEFPTIIFSNGASTLANQLYHTGMLLLLQSKPRFVDRPHSSTSMSQLWQTHRICGIAVNNDRWDCWDPSLVASLLVAAKAVTHPSQHDMILRTLETAQQLTGWNISHYVGQLRDEWRQAEGWEMA